MPNIQMLPLNLATNNSFHQVVQSEVHHQPRKPDGLTMPEVAIYLSPIGFMFSWVVLFLMLPKIRTFIENKMVFTIRSSQKVICKNCQYYSNNHYLNCAVQPSLVLTEASQDCPEYSPKQSKFYTKKNPFHKDHDSDESDQL